MKMQVVYCTHRTAPVEVRERLAFSADQAQNALRALRDRYPKAEAVLLSTCNRVELYTAAQEDADGPSHADLVHFVAGFHGVDAGELFEQVFESSGEDAIRHLFMVAASLDSMVLGEPQIVGQVKQAYQLATQFECTGPLTNQLFQESLRVAKRISTETQIAQRRVSIPSVAICDFATQHFERFDDKRVLVIGAGAMAEETVQYLREAGAWQVVVVNRSLARAQALADQWGGDAAPWENLWRELTAADLVVSTAGAEEPIVTLNDFREHVEPGRYQRPLFLLDLAIPRNFEPAIGDELGVYLYSIDDLRQACDRNRTARDAELPKAMRIIDEETERFLAELHHQATGPIIKRLRESWQQIKEEELARLFRKLPDLEDRRRAEINQAFDRLINKLLHPPLHSLRDESKSGGQSLLDALKRLFRID